MISQEYYFGNSSLNGLAAGIFSWRFVSPCQCLHPWYCCNIDQLYIKRYDCQFFRLPTRKSIYKPKHPVISSLLVRLIKSIDFDYESYRIKRKVIQVVHSINTTCPCVCLWLLLLAVTACIPHRQQIIVQINARSNKPVRAQHSLHTLSCLWRLQSLIVNVLEEFLS